MELGGVDEGTPGHGQREGMEMGRVAKLVALTGGPCLQGGHIPSS